MKKLILVLIALSARHAFCQSQNVTATPGTGTLISPSTFLTNTSNATNIVIGVNSQGSKFNWVNVNKTGSHLNDVGAPNADYNLNNFALTNASLISASSFIGLLSGTATNSTALNNQAGSYYLSRSNHTGTQGWSTITGTPSTLSGYGITDAQLHNTILDDVSAKNGKQVLPSVVAFGATGDGTTDDTTAIQAAINAGGCYIPRGVNQASATAVLTSTANYSNNETVTIGGSFTGAQIYTFKSTLTGAANEVKVGSSEAVSISNLAAAINGGNVAGTNYGTGTVKNILVTAVASTHTLTITAIGDGTWANALGTTETAANASWGGSLMTGGVNGYEISHEISVPSNRTIIIDPSASLHRKDSSLTSGECEFFRNSDYTGGNCNITISGGLLDCNNPNQTRAETSTFPGFCQVGIRMLNVSNFQLRDLEIKNPVTFSIQVGNVSNFLISGVLLSNTNLIPNMDGVHVNGPAKNFTIERIKGVTSDDFVALNADDFIWADPTNGPITDGVIRDLYQLPNNPKAMRLLSGPLDGSSGSIIDRITFEKIRGYFDYAVVYTSEGTAGKANIGNISINDVQTYSGLSGGVIRSTSTVTPISVLLNDIQLPASNFSAVYLEAGYAMQNISASNVRYLDTRTSGASGAVLDIRGAVKSLQGSNILADCVTGIGGTVLGVSGGGTIDAAQLSNIRGRNATYGVIVTGSTSSVNKLLINNCSLKDSGWMVLNSGAATVSYLELSNSVMDGAILASLEVSASTLTSCHINNFVALGGATPLKWSGTPVSTTSLKIGQFTRPSGSVFSLSGSPSISLSTIAFAVDKSTLTPVSGDVILSSVAGEGVLYYSGSAWVQNATLGANTFTGNQIVTGNLTSTGIFTVGSGPTTLTDASGKVLSAALNTVAIAQGGTGSTTAAGALTALGAAGLTSNTFTGTQTVNSGSDGTTFTASGIARAGSSSNLNLTIEPKGTGYLSADSTGNTRGVQSVDLQRVRGSASQVASGTGAALIGGTSNTASGGYAFVGGGNSNTASGLYSAALGSGSTASGSNSAVVGGANGTASRLYEQCFPSFISGQAAGTFQKTFTRLGVTSGDASGGVILSLDGSGTRWAVASGKGYLCTAKIYARGTGGGSSASWTRQFLIQNNSGTTSIVGTIDTVGTDKGSNAGIPPVGWGIAIAADDTNDALQITYTGPAFPSSILADIEAIEVAY